MKMNSNYINQNWMEIMTGVLDQARFKPFFDFKKGSEIRPKINGFQKIEKSNRANKTNELQSKRDLDSLSSSPHDQAKSHVRKKLKSIFVFSLNI